MGSTVTLRPSDSSLLTSSCLSVSGVEAIEVVSPKIPIFDGCLQNVEGNDEEGVGGASAHSTQAVMLFLCTAGINDLHGPLLLAAKRRTPHKIDKFLLVLPAFWASATVRCASRASRPYS